MFPFFLSFFISSFLPSFHSVPHPFLIFHDVLRPMSVGLLVDKEESEKCAKRHSWSNRALSGNFSAELRERMKNFGISGVSAGTRWIQIHSATAAQAVQTSGSVITWYNVVLCLARKIINDNKRQMSVKRIGLYIKYKSKIPNNIGHIEHSTRSLQPKSLFENLYTNFITPFSPNCRTSKIRHTPMADVKKRDVNCIAK
jgi:hypothetical protein